MLNEIERPHELLFGALLPADSPMTQLKLKLGSYHLIELNVLNIDRRISALEGIHQTLKILWADAGIQRTVVAGQRGGGRVSPDHEREIDNLKTFIWEVVSRLNYFKKLKKYKEYIGPKKQKLSSLLRSLVTEEAIDYYQSKATGLHIRLKKEKFQEKIDPMGRMNREVKQRYATWVRRQMADGDDPAENLVEFLLSIDGETTNDKNAYFSKERINAAILLFDEAQHTVEAYYCEEAGKFHRCDPRFDIYSSLEEDVSRELFDTFDKANYVISSGIRPGERDMAYSNIYIMRKNKFYSYKTLGNAHSMGLQGKTVQSAGMIAASEGKIQAIDNRSGHYGPGWINLLQAVKFLNNKQVFDHEAVVALYAGGDNNAIFFSVTEFLSLANQGFPYVETMRVIQQNKLDYSDAKPYPDSKHQFLRSIVWIRGGQWTWDDAIADFTELYYPGIAIAKKIIDERKSWNLSVFKNKTDAGIFATRGRSLRAIDSKLQIFDQSHEELKRLIQTVAPSNMEFVRVAMDAANNLRDLATATFAWLEIKKTDTRTTRKPKIKEFSGLLLQDLQEFGKLIDLRVGGNRAL